VNITLVFLFVPLTSLHVLVEGTHCNRDSDLGALDSPPGNKNGRNKNLPLVSI